MKTPEFSNPGFSRRDYLKMSGLALGALATGGATSRYGGGSPWAPVGNCYPTHFKTQQYTYYDQLKPIVPGAGISPATLPAPGLRKMKCASLSWVQWFRWPAGPQAEMSILSKSGGLPTPTERTADRWTSLFRLWLRVSAKLSGLRRWLCPDGQNLINHLHADHMTDLIQVYGFGDGGDRKIPLFVWGHGPSQVPNLDDQHWPTPPIPMVQPEPRPTPMASDPPITTTAWRPSALIFGKPAAGTPKAKPSRAPLIRATRP